jgi:hypothetical protein
MILSVSCTDKWKETTGLSVSLKSKPVVNSSFLSVQSTELGITGFSFNGTRKQGAEISFSESPDKTFDIELTDTISQGVMNFDLPQGTYQQVGIRYSLYQINGSPSLKLFGRYIKFTPPYENEEYYYQITYNLNQLVQSQVHLPTDGIDVVPGNVYELSISIDLNYLLGSYTEYDFRAANKKNYNGHEYIFIDTQNNYNLYDKFKSRIADSFSSELLKM